MKLLVDTHAFLWFVAGNRRLSATARRAMEHEENEWWLSAASVWEMAIKVSLGRLTLPMPAHDYVADKVRHGLRVLPVDWPHAAAVERLPFHHRDPFDRLIAAQALTEGLTLVSRDSAFRKYGVQIAW